MSTITTTATTTTKYFCQRPIHDGTDCLVLDGAMGTTLAQAGLSESEAWTAGWRLNEPKLRNATKTAHMNFLNAGCDILTANTYRVYPESVNLFLESNGKSSKGSEYDYAGHITKWTCAGFDLAIECVDEYMASGNNNTNNKKKKKPIIAVSIGTFGITIPGRTETANRIYDESMADVYNKKGFGHTLPEIEHYFDMRLSNEILSHVRNYCGENNDSIAFAFETCGDLLECQAICNVIERKSSLMKNIDCWITFTCSTAETVDSGDTLKSCIEVICQCPHINALGVNCTEPEFILPLLKVINTTLKENNASDRVIVVYPNSGERYIARTLTNEEHEHWKNDGAQKIHVHDGDSFETAALQWIQNGANIVGGCCRITHNDIEKLVKKVHGGASM